MPAKKVLVQCTRCFGRKVVTTRVGKNSFTSTCPKCNGTGLMTKKVKRAT